MRLCTFWIVGLLALLTGCAFGHLGYDPSSSPPAPNTGCLGKEVLACVDTLRPQLQADGLDADVQKQLGANSAVDVNGRSLGRVRRLVLETHTPELPNNALALDYDRSNIVTSMQITLPVEPAGMETAGAYDATRTLASLRLACGTPCADVSADEFRKFFAALEAYHLHIAHDDRQRLRVVDYGQGVYTDYARWSDPMPFHGFHLQYAFVLEHRPHFIDADNKTGISIRYPVLILSK
ncbi:MAG TPA: hypothetical protein VL574_14700 [Stellaceae bacterium]|jgi:hypothetical protein|nr:hypothetical protein [Stellaceae bacterium]